MPYQYQHHTSEELTDDVTSMILHQDLDDETGELPVLPVGSTAVGNISRPPYPPVLVVKRGPNAGARFLFKHPVTSVGRHPGSDIVLDDVTVSRRHAEFRWEDGALIVVDVGSLNGTYVNRQLTESRVLIPGDQLQVGKFRLVFLCAPEPIEDQYLARPQPPTP
jgi:pSer/pThr/pTyr-binding forkhead associated (FHA) protein